MTERQCAGLEMYIHGAQKTAGGALRLKGSNPFPGAKKVLCVMSDVDVGRFKCYIVPV